MKNIFIFVSLTQFFIAFFGELSAEIGRSYGIINQTKEQQARRVAKKSLEYLRSTPAAFHYSVHT